MTTSVIITILFDLGCAVSTDVLLHGHLSLTMHGDSFSWYFYNESGDCVVMALARTILLPLVAYLAIRGGTIPTHDDELKAMEKPSACGCFKCFYRGKYSALSVDDTDPVRRTYDSHGDIGQPLLER
jgi:hypothetical protein